MKFYVGGFCAVCVLLFGESSGSYERLGSRSGHIRFVDVINNSEKIEYSKGLLRAAQEGKEEEVRSFVIKGGNVNFKGDRGVTPLISATEKRHTGIVKYLLCCSADVDAQRSDNLHTSLMIACLNNDMEIAKSLMKFGADINLKNDMGCTAVDIAITKNNAEMIMELIIPYKELDALFELIEDRNTKLLFYATRRSQRNVIRYCIENLRVDVNSKGKNGETPLIIACKNRNDDVVEYLIEHGAETNEKMEGNSTALMFACVGCFQNIVKMLIEFDADVNIVDDRHNSPLLFAVNGGHLEIARMLREAGAEVDKMNNQEETPLSIALSHYESARIGQRYTEQIQWKKMVELLKVDRSKFSLNSLLH